MANLDIPLTVGFFLIVTGALTWTAFAIVGVYHVLTFIENVMNRIDGAAKRRRMPKIYRA